MQRLRFTCNVEVRQTSLKSVGSNRRFLTDTIAIDSNRELDDTEPEQFPDLIYRMDDPKVVFLVFSSGKLVCTGGKKEGEVHRAVTKLREELDEKSLITCE